MFVTLADACRGYQHFGNKGPRRSWIPSQRTVIFISVAGGFVYFGNQQEVPYTGRKHLMLVPLEIEKSLGQSTFEMVSQSLVGKYRRVSKGRLPLLTSSAGCWLRSCL